MWNRHNPRERLWTSRTRQLQGTHVTRYDRLWSTLPYLRPLLTVTNDTLESYGADQDGGRVHDLLGARCDPYINRLLSGADFDFHCHSNLTRAVLPYGLTEFDVHDVLNIFTVTGINAEGQYFMKPSPAQPGDFFEFFAEQDLLCALSTCPAGDLSIPLWGPDARDPVEVCRPLGIEVHRPARDLTAGWTPPAPAQYRGLHGLRPPESTWDQRTWRRSARGGFGTTSSAYFPLVRCGHPAQCPDRWPPVSARSGSDLGDP